MNLRIIAGAVRGMALTTPPGRRTRPTAARAREGLFNILTHGRQGNLVRDGLFVDMFAGTGAVGLEALSRGAAHAVFVEHDRAALAVLQANIVRLGYADKSRVLACDSCRMPPLAAALPACREHPNRVIFLDPPYDSGLALPALAAARAGGWPDAVGPIILQLPAKQRFAAPADLPIAQQRRFGATCFLFLEPGDVAPHAHAP